ncbi:alpha/beta hydrolase [Actinocorallia libanotica]|uniref:alpha/beta hydrolase n=1 Tax=Actinocorallia libanotica TaxID=46162 RepID=UPI0031DDC8F9
MTELKDRADTERIVFGTVGLTGLLRLPSSPGPWPGVVLTGPFTGVKEQVAGAYAERLTAEGFATLAFDHRGFGESGGRRGHEDTQGKLEDLRDAVSVLAGRSDMAGISVVGICLGGGYAVRAAASDPRVKAVAGIAGAYNSPAHLIESMGVTNYRAALAGFLDDYDEFLPAVAPDGGEAAMGGDEPYAYYGTSRSASLHWENRVTRGSLHSLMTFDALSAADLLGDTPLLVVHGRTDAYCSPDLARALYDRSPGPKEIRWLDTEEHIDLYDVEPHVTAATEATAAFLRSVLASPPDREGA